jgi:hypothetical protein
MLRDSSRLLSSCERRLTKLLGDSPNSALRRMVEKFKRSVPARDIQTLRVLQHMLFRPVAQCASNDCESQSNGAQNRVDAGPGPVRLRRVHQEAYALRPQAAWRDNTLYGRQVAAIVPC